MADEFSAERRIKAAMALAGIESTDVLAERAELPWRGRTLRQHIQEGKLTRIHLEPIARACGLPYEWFTQDIARAFGHAPDLPAKNSARLDRLEHTVDAILHVLRAAPKPTGDANGGPSLLDLLPEGLPEGWPLETQESPPDQESPRPFRRPA
jgi:hypothetical protein